MTPRALAFATAVVLFLNAVWLFFVAWGVLGAVLTGSIGFCAEVNRYGEAPLDFLLLAALFALCLYLGLANLAESE